MGWYRDSERGASDVGLAVSALGIAVLISVVVTLRGCIQDYKEARQERLMSYSEKKKVTGIGVSREPGGYTVTYHDF